MSQAKSYKTLTEITELIHHPRFSARYRNVREWGGADVIITASPIMQNTTKTVVTTRHALALSWLFCQLRDYTILSKHSTRKVWGIIVELDTDDLNSLDEREGYPSHYNRHKCVVYTENIRKINAQVYIACPEYIIEEQLPNHVYLEYIIKGGHNCGLPYAYVQAIKGLGQKVG